jgi:DNA-binding NarL/FixJ family response regulator
MDSVSLNVRTPAFPTDAATCGFRILIVSDRRPFQSAMMRIVQDQLDMKLVHAVHAGEASIYLPVLSYDAVIVDSSIIGGAENIKAIKKDRGRPVIAVHSADARDIDLTAWLAAGADFVAAGGDGSAELMNRLKEMLIGAPRSAALSTVPAGVSALSPAVAGHTDFARSERPVGDIMRAGLGHPDLTRPDLTRPDLAHADLTPGEIYRADRHDRLGSHALTGREMEICHLLNKGLSNKQIARRLFISESTVKNHIHSILQKLDVRSRWQAAAWVGASRSVPTAGAPR